MNDEFSKLDLNLNTHHSPLTIHNQPSSHVRVMWGIKIRLVYPCSRCATQCSNFRICICLVLSTSVSEFGNRWVRLKLAGDCIYLFI